VKENLDAKQIQYLKDVAEDEFKHFITVPIEDVIEVKPTMDISLNPVIHYRNNESGICAFASFASVLHYKGFIREAEFIMQLCKNAKLDVDVQFETMSSIAKNIDSSKVFKRYRKIYQNHKVKRTQLLHPINSSKDDIFLVILKQSDGHCSHAVALTDDFVFDCNTTNALPRTKEGIDCCCGNSASFVEFHKGYHFRLQRKQK